MYKMWSNNNLCILSNGLFRHLFVSNCVHILYLVLLHHSLGIFHHRYNCVFLSFYIHILYMFCCVFHFRYLSMLSLCVLLYLLFLHILYIYSNDMYYPWVDNGNGTHSGTCCTCSTVCSIAIIYPCFYCV